MAITIAEKFESKFHGVGHKVGNACIRVYHDDDNNAYIEFRDGSVIMETVPNRLRALTKEDFAALDPSRMTVRYPGTEVNLIVKGKA